MTEKIVNVIPEPVKRVDSVGQFSLNDSVKVTADPAAVEVANYLVEALLAETGVHSSIAENGQVRLVIKPGQPAEGYQIRIDATGVELTASEPVGLFWGIQTIRQLLTQSRTAWSLGFTEITDYPRFSYRGAMLDVARHFFGVKDVKRYIDDIVLLKLNYLHLHLTDDQGWRIAIDGWPNLTDYGSTTQVNGGGGGYFSQDDYREIVRYAQSRFVTIVPEIDLPGHTNAALASYPELNCDGKAPALYEGIEVGFSSLCVDKEVTYKFIEDVLDQVAKLTPGPYLHIGGDEAHSTPESDYLRFIARASKIAAATGKTVVGWHEMGRSPDLPEGSVGQYWSYTDPREDAAVVAKQFVSKGGKIILSPANAIYLDMKYDQSTPLGLVWADGPTSIRRSYEWEPLEVIPGLNESDLLGLEAPLWTETITNINEIERMAFPRIASAAQISWSPKSHADFDTFAEQLSDFGQVLKRLGINFEPAEGVAWK